MATREEMIQMLAGLDAATLEDVVNTAYQRRGEPADAGPMPGPADGPETFALWLAHRHMGSDASIERVVYLPDGAPEDEIRLLEVNRFLSADDDDEVEPLDFTLDDAEWPSRVFVADVTKDQWELIKSAPEGRLPAGWKLGENHRIFARG